MKARVLTALLLVANFVHAADGIAPEMLAPIPAGWSSMAGNGGPLALPGVCEIGVDGQKSVAGHQAYTVRCNNPVLPSYGGARNTIRTAQFRGKRVRVSAWLMASGISGVPTPQYSGVAGEGGLWIGVGSQKGGTRMDRMQNRTIKGTTDWEYRDFVVDVPDDNNQMFIGYWMQGKGQLWVRDFNIEEVPTTVAVNFLVNDPDRAIGPDLTLLSMTPPRPDEIFLAPPAKWLAMGTPGYELCDVGVDARMLQAGQRNLSIACGVPQSVAMTQSAEAAPFWGKRVRFSGWLKADKLESATQEGARNGAGLMMSTTDAQGRTVRAEVGNASDWQYRELIVEVPRNSRWIIVGLTLNGRGQLWARDFKFEEVPAATPLSP